MPATEQQKKELKKALAGSKALFEEALAKAKVLVETAKASILGLRRPRRQARQNLIHS